MPDIVVAKAFTLTLASGETAHFPMGIHKDVLPEVAGHWFTKAHLAMDGQLPEPPSTIPLTHEERMQTKAAMDASEGRARAFEAERDAAVARADALHAELETERHAHAETRSLLDAATAPNGGDPDETIGAYTVRRGYQGSYKVLKGDEAVAEGLSKAEAEAKARELNGQN